MIIRVEKRTHYVVVDARTVLDKRLSFAALGLITYLLNNATSWEVYPKQIVKERPSASLYQVTNLLSELREHGYAVLIPQRGEGGRLKGSTWVIRELSSDLAGRATTEEADSGASDRTERGDLTETPDSAASVELSTSEKPPATETPDSPSSGDYRDSEIPELGGLPSLGFSRPLTKNNSSTKTNPSNQHQHQHQLGDGHLGNGHLDERQPDENDVVGVAQKKLLEELLKRGVTATRAAQLIASHDEERIARNLSWYDAEEAQGRARSRGLLITAIKDDYAGGEQRAQMRKVTIEEHVASRERAETTEARRKAPPSPAELSQAKHRAIDALPRRLYTLFERYGEQHREVQAAIGPGTDLFIQALSEVLAERETD